MRFFWAAGVPLALASLGMAADGIPFDAKTGLWEATTTFENDAMAASGRSMPQIPQDKLDKMPPAQRAQVEAMLKNAGGAPRTITSKHCLTEDTLKHGWQTPSRSTSCTQTVVSSSSSKMVMHVECAQPPSSSEVTVERVDSEHVKANMLTKTTIQGNSTTIKMNMSEKWVSADCGDVKPAGPK